MIGTELLRRFNDDFLLFDYNQIRDEFSKIFISQCGNLKFQDVKRRIDKSNTFNKLIASSRLNKTAVNDKSIVGALLTIPYFIFKDGYTQFLASLFAIERWNKETNSFTRVQTEENLKFVCGEMFLYIDRTRGFRI